MSDSTQATLPCAYCDSKDTELMSLFGQTLMGSQYYCRHCGSVFEVVRHTEEEVRSEQSRVSSE